MFFKEEMVRDAVFSDCLRYRYTLERTWDSGPSLLWVLLNPSSATAEKDDPTNRRGISFSKAWGYGACTFVNLFAYRTPHPFIMMRAEEPVGPINNFHILEQAEKADAVVVAWGTNGGHLGRDEKVLKLLRGYRLQCLGRTKAGHPKHPLFLKADIKLEEFRAPMRRELLI